MSADNWAVCPRCLARKRAEHEALSLRVVDAYGVLPVDEYDALRAEAAEPLNRADLVSFREDYEIGTFEDGEFFISYGGKCDVCGLAHSFKHSEQLDIETRADA